MASLQLKSAVHSYLPKAILRARAIPVLIGKRLETTPAKRMLPKSLDIMFFVNKHNSLSQRVAAELTARKHRIQICEIDKSEEMVALANERKPDMILCPFLTKRVPEEVYGDPTIPCLIVHPGIEGDRGMSSIDWALKEDEKSWGATVMQAAKEMDSGDVWSTGEFPIDRENTNSLTKSSLYVHEVTNAAVDNCLQAINNLAFGTKPRPLDYSQPNVRGRLRRNMKKADRVVDWELPAWDVARQVRMSDSSPGAVGRFRLRGMGSEWSEEFRLFGSYIEKTESFNKANAAPGEIIGERENGILVKCGVGSLWISHLKRAKLKLPASYWLSQDMNIAHLPAPPHEVPHGTFPETFQEIWTSVTPEGICNVNFEFYNGAMSSDQCTRLLSVLRDVERDERIKVVVLKGGYNFFSNGIHLNVIENAPDPSVESWRNINAIDDVVKAIFMSRKLTISAVQGNAGAGGAMMALASDLALARDGVVLNPHYRLMHLYGSEYHTYFLPERVGKDKAQELLTSATPISASEAVSIGMLDYAYGRTNQQFTDYVEDVAKELASRTSEWMRNKDAGRTEEWVQKLEEHRAHELSIMKNNFTSSDYINARKAFVYH